MVVMQLFAFAGVRHPYTAAAFTQASSMSLRIFIPIEADPRETRIAMVPEVAGKLSKAGIEVRIQAGLGRRLGWADALYEAAGAKIEAGPSAGYGEADMVLRVMPPAVEEVKALRRGCIHVSHLDPFGQPSLVRALAEAGITAVSMEMMPRTTVAQKMDALSSQANLAGYVAVLLAAERSDKIFPMMSTPAGTIAPARVLVIGAGVAGLQAIATAKRLGAVVEAFDTRPVVEEQVRSLGARFIKVDLGETGQTKDGYAKALTEEQLARQREALARTCASADVVITTAKVFGRKAPVIVTDEMLSGMGQGSVVVDLAVEAGGNVAGSVAGEEREVRGVRVLGLTNLAGRVPLASSQVYASNLGNFVLHFWDKTKSQFNLDLQHEILRGCVLTHQGRIIHDTVRAAQEAVKG
jgi:H+-translocating NAD(P) transhydrogenase subunit alpha